jgi:dTDP-4-amino-4,6-dideoxygalactose transaminase
MLTVNDDEFADKLRRLACHGMRPRYHHAHVGINSRLDTIQAAVLEVKLRHLSTWTERRQANAARYGQLFREAGLADWLGLPGEAPHCRHVWNQYTIRVPGGQRDRLRSWLSDRGVGTEIYYPMPLHLQECFRSLGYAPGSLPETERAAQEVLSLPIYAELTREEQEYVVEQIAAFHLAERSLAA